MSWIVARYKKTKIHMLTNHDLMILYQLTVKYDQISKHVHIKQITRFWIMFILSLLIVWTYSITLILPFSTPCLCSASRAMKVPVRPIPALKFNIENEWIDKNCFLNIILWRSSYTHKHTHTAVTVFRWISF